ncbi:MAG: ABC transporter substrate-binding protein [Candidatus Vecturithrix sp.]|jgi:two-component system chemotaxis sensor kinase CheA|nr:ABC transporter substrate-binding protein [Candidatus Vecturithrix sp.]
MPSETPELTKIELYGVSDPNISGQLILAKEKGFFQEEGLDVSYRLLSSGTIMPEEIMNASKKPFAFTQTPITTLVLQEKGLDVKIVAPLADISGTQQIVVHQHANIRKPQDLQGKRIGMAKGAAVYIAVQGMAKEFGIDLSTVEFVYLLPAQQLEAMEKGEVDAIACWEPWTSKAQAIGGQFWFSGARSEIPDNEGNINWLVDQSVLMTFRENLEKYPHTVQAVIRAFCKATTFINQHLDQAAALLATPLALKKEELEQILSLNKYSMTMDNLFKIGLLSFRELLFQNGVISSKPLETDLYATEFLKNVDPELVLIEEETVEEDEELQEYLTIFFDEVDDILRKLDNDAVALENAPQEKARLKAITGAFHTLKGNAGFLGFEKITTASKQIEGYLKKLLLEEDLEVPKPVISLIFYAIDVLKTLVKDYKDTRTSNFDISVLQQRISQLSPELEEKVEVPVPHGGIELSGYEALKLREAKKKGKSIYQLDIRFDAEWKMKSAGAFIIIRKLGLHGEVVKVVPSLGSKDFKTADEVKLLYTTDVDKTCILNAANVAVVVASVNLSLFTLPEILVVQKEDSEYLEEFATGEEAFTFGAKTKSRTLRVDYKKLDDIVNIIGELIIGGSTLARGLNEVRDSLDGVQTPAKLLNQLQKTSANIRKNLLNLQENIMEVRMTPIDIVFRKFPKIVRDLALKSGKEVKLQVRGEETDLDKTLVDVIDEPLLHLIKNTIDHSIEPPMVREQLGKPKKGTIELISFREGNQIVIMVKDDGRGMDLEKIKRHTFESGMITAEKLQKLSKAETFNLLFLDSSGNLSADGLAGERSGMMIVRQTVENLNGSVELDSRLGEGTIFTIKLPLTLAIIQAMVFEVGNRTFAIPLSNVVEAIRLQPEHISVIGNREVFELRNEVVNLLRPHAILGIPQPPASKKKLSVIVVHSSDRQLVGILADQLLEKEELVIKSLDNKIMRSEITSSASKLGDGKVVLILDVPALIQSVFG